jgi:hypothetical protein
MLARGCFLLALLAHVEAHAQYCVGSTRYVVRDAVGKHMTPDQLRRLEITHINGARAARSLPDKNPVVYEALPDPKHSPYRIPLTNPFFIGMDHCGSIRELTLRFEGKTMQLRFEIGEHNTSYLIESLPFQAGDFTLHRENSWSLPCAGGKGPPLIDNEHSGSCRVVSQLWAPTRGGGAGAGGGQ